MFNINFFIFREGIIVYQDHCCMIVLKTYTIHTFLTDSRSVKKHGVRNQCQYG